MGTASALSTTASARTAWKRIFVIVIESAGIFSMKRNDPSPKYSIYVRLMMFAYETVDYPCGSFTPSQLNTGHRTPRDRRLRQYFRVRCLLRPKHLSMYFDRHWRIKRWSESPVRTEFSLFGARSTSRMQFCGVKSSRIIIRAYTR